MFSFSVERESATEVTRSEARVDIDANDTENNGGLPKHTGRTLSSNGTIGEVNRVKSAIKKSENSHSEAFVSDNIEVVNTEAEKVTDTNVTINSVKDIVTLRLNTDLVETRAEAERGKDNNLRKCSSNNCSLTSCDKNYFSRPKNECISRPDSNGKFSRPENNCFSRPDSNGGFSRPENCSKTGLMKTGTRPKNCSENRLENCSNVLVGIETGLELGSRTGPNVVVEVETELGTKLELNSKTTSGESEIKYTMKNSAFIESEGGLSPILSNPILSSRGQSVHGPNEGGPSPRQKNWSETTDTSFDSVIYRRLHKNVELNEKVEKKISCTVQK